MSSRTPPTTTTTRPATTGQPPPHPRRTWHLLKLHVARNKPEAEAAYQRLGQRLEGLSRQGYSPTSITGVGEHLFLLVEHERALQRRLFAPMARYLQFLDDISDETEDPPSPSPSPSPSDEPVDITVPVSDGPTDTAPSRQEASGG
jgi:hypothetical protein